MAFAISERSEWAILRTKKLKMCGAERKLQEGGEISLFVIFNIIMMLAPLGDGP
jgi:hypothetical protein